MKTFYVYKNTRSGKYYSFRENDTSDINKAQKVTKFQVVTGLTGYLRVSVKDEIISQRKNKLNKINANSR